MKIFHVTPYYPPHLGGMENNVKELADRTALEGYDVEIYTSNIGFNSNSNVNIQNNINIKRFKALKIPGTPPLIPKMPVKLYNNIDKSSIVHFHYILNFSIDHAIILSKLKNAKIVTHIHIDPLPSGPLGFLNPTYKKLFWGRILSLSDSVICPTQDYVDIITQKYGVDNHKCIVIPPGVDLAKFHNLKKFGRISSPVNVLYIGRISKQKNIPRLLNAFKLLTKKYDCILHIVGDGEERSTVENIIVKENIENVKLYGQIPHQNITNLYKNCDIFVLPSDYESFGIVNIEAMASSIPIVATNIPGVRNVIKDCGLLVKPSSESIAKAIIKLIENPKLRNELVTKGKIASEKYDWDNINQQIINNYNNLK